MRTVVFCDGGYLSSVIINHFDRVRVDYAKLIQELLEPDEKLIRVYFYDALPFSPSNPSPDDQQRLERKNN